MTQQSFGATSVLSETVSIEYGMELPSLFPMNADRFCRFEVWREYRIIVSRARQCAASGSISPR